MIVEITLCAVCLGSFAVYIAYVASKIQGPDPVVFAGKGEAALASGSSGKASGENSDPKPQTVFLGMLRSISTMNRNRILI